MRIEISYTLVVASTFVATKVFGFGLRTYNVTPAIPASIAITPQLMAIDVSSELSVIGKRVGEGTGTVPDTCGNVGERVKLSNVGVGEKVKISNVGGGVDVGCRVEVGDEVGHSCGKSHIHELRPAVQLMRPPFGQHAHSVIKPPPLLPLLVHTLPVSIPLQKSPLQALYSNGTGGAVHAITGQYW